MVQQKVSHLLEMIFVVLAKVQNLNLELLLLHVVDVMVQGTKLSDKAHLQFNKHVEIVMELEL